MKRGDGGFMLLDVLMAAGVLAMAGLAALEASRWSDHQRRNIANQVDVANCAEERLAETLMTSTTEMTFCKSALRTECFTAVKDGNVEEVRWAISAPGRGTEPFDTIRYAR